MNILLAGFFVMLLPVAVAAQPVGTVAPGKFDFSIPADASTADDSTDALNWFQNPYRPASPTNFEVFIAPSLSPNAQQDPLLSRPVAPHLYYGLSGGSDSLYSAQHGTSTGGVFSSHRLFHISPDSAQWSTSWHHGHHRSH